LVRAAVIGCGGTGLVLASALAIKGFIVRLFCLSDEDVVTILRNNGVISVHGRGEASVKVSAAHISFLRGGYDLVVYAVRLNAVREVFETVSAKLPDSEHVFIQPSIDVLEIAKGEKWGFLALYTCVRRIAPGVAEWPGEGFVEILGRDGLVSYLGEGLGSMGLRTLFRNSAEDVIWNYFAVNLATQPVAALLGLPLSRLAKNDYARNIIAQLWGEAELVAKEHGIALRRELLDKFLSIRGCIPRMLQDIEQRIPTEIDYINGALLREALGKGVYVPYNDAIYLLVKSLEEEMRSSRQ